MASSPPRERRAERRAERGAERAPAAARATPAAPTAAPIAALDALHDRLGNRGMLRLLRARGAERGTKAGIQPTLAIGPADDPFEREADAAAARIAAGRPAGRISRLPAAPVQRTCPQCALPMATPAAATGAAPLPCPACAAEERRVALAADTARSAQRATATGTGQPDGERAEQAMAGAGPGSPLAPAMRQTMEQRFGADFADVRIHTDDAADAASRAIEARAFTHGADIYLARDESASDSRLIAHELTHTLQQGESPDRAQRQEGEGTAQSLIGRYSGLTGLDEEGLAERLFELAWMSPAHYAIVLQVINSLDDTDRDDVAVAMVGLARDENLDEFAATVEGRAMLDRLYAEMMEGSVGSDEEEQGRRIVLAKGRRIPAEQFIEAAEGTAMIFPFRLPGFTVLDDSPIMAERLASGNIHVKLPVRVLGTSAFRAETRTLPTDVFIGGIELPPDQIVGVRLYDQGGRIEFLPALSLVGFSGQATTTVYQKIGEAAAIGATFGLGGGVAIGAEATWGARAILWLDRAGMAIFLVSTLINEHRGWILENFPRVGPPFLRAVDIANSVAAVYGVWRLAVDGYRAVVSLRNAWRAWRQEAAAARLASAEREIVEQVNRSTDDLLNDVDQARTERGLPAGRAEEAAGGALTPALREWEEGLSDATRELLSRNPDLRRRFASLGPTARRLLTHCSRLCVPPGLTDVDVRRIENLLTRIEGDPRGFSMADEWMLREYFYARQATISAAIADIEGSANLAQLRSRLRQAASQRALTTPAAGGHVGASGYPGTWGSIRSRSYGHSVSEHGAEIDAFRLMDRARDPRRAADVGQWYDNSLIIQSEQRATANTIVNTLPNGTTIHEFDMGRAVGRVFTPAGTIVSDVTRVRVVRFPNGTLQTSFPVQ